MQLRSQLAAFMASADGVFECLWIIVWEPGKTALACCCLLGVDSQMRVTIAQ